jgi:hypothetical protein
MFVGSNAGMYGNNSMTNMHMNQMAMGQGHVGMQGRQGMGTNMGMGLGMGFGMGFGNGVINGTLVLKGNCMTI